MEVEGKNPLFFVLFVGMHGLSFIKSVSFSPLTDMGDFSKCKLVLCSFRNGNLMTGMILFSYILKSFFLYWLCIY